MDTEGAQGIAKEFSGAGPFFAAARDAGLFLDHLKAQEEAVASSARLRGTADGPIHQGWLRRNEALRKRSAAIVEAAELACLGVDGRGGIAALLYTRYADAMAAHHQYHLTWPETAESVGMSERWCQNAIPKAFAEIDAMGLARFLDEWCGPRMTLREFLDRQSAEAAED